MRYEKLLLTFLRTKNVFAKIVNGKTIRNNGSKSNATPRDSALANKKFTNIA